MILFGLIGLSIVIVVGIGILLWSGSVLLSGSGMIGIMIGFVLWLRGRLWSEMIGIMSIGVRILLIVLRLFMSLRNLFELSVIVKMFFC